ncbi:UvrD-helicase domain-containing protein [Luteococcus japonicus]|uniref:RecBCD enzyme subunit RecB n=2 Tax=Luteococcus TaxID=33983 RepID=A0A1R4JVK1_9ACTN|nr:UvrD-helicase domain-containing protein [Luteococcus japonicus]SJN36110.1 Exodeoxyribonuclease V beta chain [Luteococcus japonicus LSP_Lj1]
MKPFDLCGPLPTGTCVLEASAGTGKTYAITALAVRYLAEGHHRLDQIMMVTFSRAATSELRHRVHARLRSTAAALAAWLEHGTVPLDEVDALLVQAPTQEVVQRMQRVRSALAEIDAATIATTHEFCSRMLSGLGLLVDHDHTTRFVQNVDDLARQVISDVYLAREVNGQASQPGKLATWDQYRQVGRAALREPDARLVPVEATGLSRDRVDFATEVRRQFDLRKRRSGIYTFDDMVSRLRDALVHPRTGALASQMLSSRYPLVLIDEFQDTDPVQWEIVREAFVRQRSTVVLIGDPKQAIYAFRGADVFAYLQAVREADEVFTLPSNHRSDAAVVDGVLEVFAQAAMGSDQIIARPVTARHTNPRIAGPSSSPAVQVRCLTGAPRGGHGATAGARAVDADLCREVVGLLEDGWQVQEGEGWRPVQARDIAVLVRTNRRGEQVKRSLESMGVNAVFGGASSVMTSEAATSWLLLLRALVDPSTQAMKRAALTCLVGWEEAELAAAVAADEGQGASTRSVSELAVQVKTLGRILDAQGVPAVFEALCDQTDLYRRLLTHHDGERLMTDVRHIAQLLNEAAVRHELGPLALTEWLADRIEEAQHGQDDDRTRRLETDASCVQIMTIHGAKGLEFPVVLLPEAANMPHQEARAGQPTVLHLDGERVLDVGVDAQWQHRQRSRQHQEADESLRTLYVAMTRAKSRLVMWWAPTKTNTQGSPLHRLLQGPRRPGTTPELSYELPADPTDVPGLDRRLVQLVAVEPAPPRVRELAPSRHSTMAARSFTREVDQTWRRTSYSGLTHEVHGQRIAPVEQAGLDEVEIGQDPVVHLVLDDALAEAALDEGPAAGTTPDATASPLAPLPGGTQFGSLVHGVLEMTDATSPTLRADIAGHIAHLAQRLPVDGLDAEVLADGLVQVIETPLGRVADGLRLRDIPPTDWLAELDFELPMGPSTRGGRLTNLADIATALQDPALTGDDAFAARYGAHLAASDVADKTLHGFLTGSIDAVLRTTGDDRQHFWVVDYKTNRIPVAEGEQLTCRHYVPEAMRVAMIEAHYPLQALLYCVALHRFLRQRLPGYRPEIHLGGVGYLFVRGMAGEGTPVVDGMPCGVFTWLPSTALVERCSDLVGGL